MKLLSFLICISSFVLVSVFGDTPANCTFDDIVGSWIFYEGSRGHKADLDCSSTGGCGSCYAFASMAMLEARYRILTNNTQTPVFSPQDVLQCSEYAQGCAGGFPYLIAGKYAEDFGVVKENCNPYQLPEPEHGDVCKTKHSCRRYYATGYHYVGGYYGADNEPLMRMALVQNGPIAVGFEVYADFITYKSGVYHHTGITDNRNIMLNRWNPFQCDDMVLKGGNLAQTKFYDHTSVSYEDTIKKMQYGGPRDVAKMVLKHVPDKDSKIIDVVAGTGLLGAELKANGYTNVDAIDGSKRMLDIAMSRDIYNKHYCELLEENKITSLRRGFYDAAVATGCFGAGHLNNGHFLPIVKMVRKGGKLVFGINDAYFKDSPLWGEDGSEWDHDLLAAIKGRPIHKLHKQYYVRLLVQTEP